MCQWFIDFLTFKAIFTHKVPQSPKVRTHSVFPYFNALSSHKVSQSPTVCFLISMHSVHTKSLNYSQWVSSFQCTQFTQGPPITQCVFPYFNALSSHKVSQLPKVYFLISMHSVHTRSPNHPKCVFLFQCTQFTQSLPITHSVFPYFNALSSHSVPQLLTVSFFISMHSAQRVWLLFDRGVDAWSIEGLIVSWIRSWWLVDSWLMEGLKVEWQWGWWSVNRGVDGQSLEELTVGWWRSWWSVDGGVDGQRMEELTVGWWRSWWSVDGGVDSWLMEELMVSWQRSIK